MDGQEGWKREVEEEKKMWERERNRRRGGGGRGRTTEERGDEEAKGEEPSIGGGKPQPRGLSAAIVGELRQICMRCHGDFTQLNLYSSLCGGAECRGAVVEGGARGREEERRLDETEHL